MSGTRRKTIVMLCISPVYIKNPYTPDSSNWERVKDLQYIPVRCGKCYPCNLKRRHEWSARLIQESRCSAAALFLTLTYDDENLPRIDLDTGEINPEPNEEITYFNAPMKRDIQLFLKRYRKWLAKESPCKIKYYCVSEFGGETLRPHYHMLIYYSAYIQHPKYHPLADIWQQGNVCKGTLTQQSVAYVTKYHVISKKPFGDDLGSLTWSLMSKGIAKRYAEDWTQDMADNYDTSCYKVAEYSYPFPRYWRDTINKSCKLPEPEYILTTYDSQLKQAGFDKQQIIEHKRIIAEKQERYSTENFKLTL